VGGIQKFKSLNLLWTPRAWTWPPRSLSTKWRTKRRCPTGGWSSEISKTKRIFETSNLEPPGVRKAQGALLTLTPMNCPVHG
jgi:hypothetical protein